MEHIFVEVFRIKGTTYYGCLNCTHSPVPEQELEESQGACTCDDVSYVSKPLIEQKRRRRDANWPAFARGTFFNVRDRQN